MYQNTKTNAPRYALSIEGLPAEVQHFNQRQNERSISGLLSARNGKE